MTGRTGQAGQHQGNGKCTLQAVDLQGILNYHRGEELHASRTIADGSHHGSCGLRGEELGQQSPKTAVSPQTEREHSAPAANVVVDQVLPPAGGLGDGGGCQEAVKRNRWTTTEAIRDEAEGKAACEKVRIC